REQLPRALSQGETMRVQLYVTSNNQLVCLAHEVLHRSGIFFKAMANFQWDRLLKTDIISPAYLDGCYALGQQYPDLCSSIYLVCESGA
ncbi:MAG: hypothetical protein ACK5O3_14530, partial [Burkholderiales bacterium]